MNKSIIRIFLMLILVFSLVTLSSCNLFNGGINGDSISSIRKTSTDGHVDTYIVEFSNGEEYSFRINNGVNGEDGTTGNDGEDGINGIDGFPGLDGKQIDFAIEDGFIVWKYRDDNVFNKLISLENLKGEQGIKGEQGPSGEVSDNNIDYEDIVDLEQYLQNLAIKLAPTVVTIEVYTVNFRDEYVLHSSASGFVYEEDYEFGYIYTNAHAVDYRIGEEIYFYDVIYHNAKRVKAEFITRDQVEDVAVLRVPKSHNYEVAVLGDSDDISKGETVIALGSPLSIHYEKTYSVGRIINYNVPFQVEKRVWGRSRVERLYLIQSNVPINQGNSGGPLFNLKGEVIGVNAFKLVSNFEVLQGFNFSIPINHFRYIAEYSIENMIDMYYRPTLNIEVYDLMYQSLATRLENDKMIYDNGLLIINVLDYSINKDVLKVNDTIIEIQGIPIIDVNDFTVELIKYLNGDVIRLTVMRDGIKMYIDVTVDKKSWLK